MNSTGKKHSIVIGGRQTSISLEDDFWMSLQQIARGRQMTTPDLVASLDAARENSNLSSAIRVFILEHYRAMAGRPDVGFTPLSVIPRAAVAAQSYQWAAMRRSALATDALASCAAASPPTSIDDAVKPWRRRLERDELVPDR